MRPIRFRRNVGNKETCSAPPSRKNEVSKRNRNFYRRNSQIREKRIKNNVQLIRIKICVCLWNRKHSKLSRYKINLIFQICQYPWYEICGVNKQEKWRNYENVTFNLCKTKQIICNDVLASKRFGKSNASDVNIMYLKNFWGREQY